MSDRATLPIYIVNPTTKHTHTAILLHGQGDNGADFAEELLCSSSFSEGRAGGDSEKTLPALFPSWRWVFPSAPSRWSRVFEEELSAWFDAPSLSDPTFMEDLQMDGIRESVLDISRILHDEASRLGGASQNIVLGGISQGAAVGLWALLYHGREAPCSKLGGFVGASCWLPFSSYIERVLCNTDVGQLTTDPPVPTTTTTTSLDFVNSMFKATKSSLASHSHDGPHPLLSTPVFLGHGTDDAYVDISLGRHARDVLTRVGFFEVMWKEYVGAEQEGHWFKEPEQVDDIVQFLRTVDTGQPFST
ncbi:uncharacterized protein Z520_11505 [Fonsecaea multimorphosa CBS 102226]|uniref:Phospholipase/carboxylesterase/thioesterase domain-containing protein n=1 Tax=Fonsecaea multimorphosa CBS 102226 TaxID=1442371 RepID=A0A0D2I6K2_9EURO|nr:uncharacterized protein Z520_11505 [Fonsecaea multimorphosa CBS 102226]KIX92841.1 hypothetical protein Z520_11505 [Fonsecaea multimorphosa CBS 102226]OAL18089.1 hypothetical protein AYO22_11012 [Fonsecaea multimorphosa]